MPVTIPSKIAQRVTAMGLLGQLPGTYGLKTGSIRGAYSAIIAAERENVHLLAVVLRCETSDKRFSAATNLLANRFAQTGDMAG